MTAKGMMTMTTWTEVAPVIKDIGLPLISLLGGWIGGMLRSQNRLADLENQVKAQSAKIDKQGEAFEDLSAALQGLHKTFVDRSTYAEDQALARSARAEEQKQWAAVSKALFRIEGYMEGKRDRDQRPRSIHDAD